MRLSLAVFMVQVVTTLHWVPALEPFTWEWWNEIQCQTLHATTCSWPESTRSPMALKTQWLRSSWPPSTHKAASWLPLIMDKSDAGTVQSSTRSTSNLRKWSSRNEIKRRRRMNCLTLERRSSTLSINLTCLITRTVSKTSQNKLLTTLKSSMA